MEKCLNLVEQLHGFFQSIIWWLIRVSSVYAILLLRKTNHQKYHPVIETPIVMGDGLGYSSNS